MCKPFQNILVHSITNSSFSHAHLRLTFLLRFLPGLVFPRPPFKHFIPLTPYWFFFLGFQTQIFRFMHHHGQTSFYGGFLFGLKTAPLLLQFFFIASKVFNLLSTLSFTPSCRIPIFPEIASVIFEETTHSMGLPFN